MSITVSALGPYYTSGPISFSSLRANFKESLSGTIKASELIRNTSISNTNPIVPDATENVNISSVQSNLRLSQFRNSIKSYNLTQAGLDLNLDITNQSWNNNLLKNVRKVVYITGVCATNSTSSVAASFNATAYNLIFDISGKIYGAGGTGGTSLSISGTNGGNALSVSSTSGNNIVIFVRSNAQIYGGGGGGEKGVTGSPGNSGTCYSYSQVRETYVTGNRCRSCPGCAPGWTQIDCYQREGRCDWRGQYRKSVCERYVTVTTPYSVGGAPGGEGGNGTSGRGYNNTLGSLSGVPGTPGTTGGCPSYGGTGLTGENGGNGGDWGSAGGSTTNAGSGGSAGRAIVGSNYSVVGNITSDTIKGSYLPG